METWRQGDRSSDSSLIPHPSSLSGFTLVEMLVTITILLVLAVITLTTVNFTQSYDRVRSGARQVQSYFEGAKSRAAYAKDVRGVRFLLDTADATTAASMVFIGPPEPFSQGTILVLLEDPALPIGTPIAAANDLNLNGINDSVRIGYPANWTVMPPIWLSLASRNRLSDGARIELPRKSGIYYTIALSVNGSGSWYLTRSYPGTIPAGGLELEYSLELNPAVLPNQEPRPLGVGIVIDLDNSKIPGTWRTGGVGSAYVSQLDVLFTPRGTVTGAGAGEGTIHLVLAGTSDTVNNIPPGAPAWQSATYTATDSFWVRPTVPNGCFYLRNSNGTAGGSEPAWPTGTGQTVTDGALTWECYQMTDKLLVSLFTHTGRVASNAITNFDDIFREAELGREVR